MRGVAKLCVGLFGFVMMLPAAVAQTQSQSKPPSELALGQAVPTLAATEVWRLMRATKPPAVFDVREQAEFGVSHLQGAVRLSPEADKKGDAAAARIARLAKGRNVVFYCTTSGRSERFSEVFYQDLIKAGATGVWVLRGGLVAWANAGLPLIDGKGRSTRLVHAHDVETAKHLKDGSRARY